MKLKTFTGMTVGMAAALVLGVGQAAIAADKDLVIFDWAGYEDENFYQAYIEKHGDKPTYSFFSDEEEAFNKIRAGFKADMAHPCSQSVNKWRDAGIIEPFDTSRMPEWENVSFADAEGFTVDGKVYVVPVDWVQPVLPTVPIWSAPQMPQHCNLSLIRNSRAVFRFPTMSMTPMRLAILLWVSPTGTKVRMPISRRPLIFCARCMPMSAPIGLMVPNSAS